MMMNEVTYFWACRTKKSNSCTKFSLEASHPVQVAVLLYCEICPKRHIHQSLLKSSFLNQSTRILHSVSVVKCHLKAASHKLREPIRTARHIGRVAQVCCQTAQGA